MIDEPRHRWVVALLLLSAPVWLFKLGIEAAVTQVWITVCEMPNAVRYVLFGKPK